MSTVETVNAETSADISRIALLVALVAVLLAGVMFFKASQSVDQLTANVVGLGQKAGTFEARMADLEKLPAKAKQMVLGTIIMEMAQKASYLSGQIDNQQQAAALVQAMELLQQAMPK